MKVVAYQRPDGGVDVFYPNPNAQATDVRKDGVYDTDNKGGPAHLIYPGRQYPETEQEFIDRVSFGPFRVPGAILPVAGAVPPDATKVLILDESEVPQNKKYRNAWRLP